MWEWVPWPPSRLLPSSYARPAVCAWRSTPLCPSPQHLPPAPVARAAPPPSLWMEVWCWVVRLRRCKPPPPPPDRPPDGSHPVCLPIHRIQHTRPLPTQTLTPPLLVSCSPYCPPCTQCPKQQKCIGYSIKQRDMHFVFCMRSQGDGKGACTKHVAATRPTVIASRLQLATSCLAHGRGRQAPPKQEQEACRQYLQ